MVRLGDVAEINPRPDGRLGDAEAVSFLAMADVSEEGETTGGALRAYADVRKGYTAFKDGDLLVAKITPCFENGKIAQASIGTPFGFGSTEFHVIRPQTGVDRRYVLHLLRSPEVRRSGESSMTGSAGQKRVPKGFLESLDLPLPPPAEQRRIAAILDQADALRQKRLEQLALLEEASNRRIQSILDNAEEFRSLNDLLTEPLRNGVSPSRSGTTEQRVLTLSAITRGRFDPSQSKLDLFAKVPAGDKWAREGMILICRGNGNAELVGRMVAVDAIEGDVIFPDTMIASRVSAQVSIPTLLAAWRTDAVRAQIRARARTTNGTYKINQQSLGGVLVPVPSAEDQASIDAIDAERVATTEELSASVHRLDALFASLEHRAFRGEL